MSRDSTRPPTTTMLHGNGALLDLYADAMAISPDNLFEAMVRDTAAWLLREMQHPERGFYAALDADSEGAEDRFYVWHRKQIRRLLDAWRTVVERLGLTTDEADRQRLKTTVRRRTGRA